MNRYIANACGCALFVLLVVLTAVGLHGFDTLTHVDSSLDHISSNTDKITNLVTTQIPIIVGQVGSLSLRTTQMESDLAGTIGHLRKDAEAQQKNVQQILTLVQQNLTASQDLISASTKTMDEFTTNQSKLTQESVTTMQSLAKALDQAKTTMDASERMLVAMQARINDKRIDDMLTSVAGTTAKIDAMAGIFKKQLEKPFSVWKWLGEKAAGIPKWSF